MLGAELTQALQITIGWHDQAVSARYGFDEHGGNSAWILVHHDLFDVIEAVQRAAVGIVLAEGAAIFIRIECAYHARDTRLVGPAARIARQSDRARSRTVIRSITCDDFVSSRILSR